MTIQLKICGLTEEQNVYNIIQAAKPDYLGFIFYKHSSRFVENQITPETVKSLPDDIDKTGVFVNSSLANILNVADKYGLDTLQLHGDESPEFCANCKSHDYTVIKVFGVGKALNISLMNKYSEVCDYFLFDTAGAYRGGNGEKFNWMLLNEYALDKPYFLSGGIAPEDVEILRSIEDPKFYGIDINSRFEIEPGIKDVNKIEEFSNQIKK